MAKAYLMSSDDVPAIAPATTRGRSESMASPLPRILFVHAIDAAARQAHAELRGRGYPVAWIGDGSEIAAGAAFAPDVLIADPGVLGEEFDDLLALLCDAGEGCPVILLHQPGHYRGAPIDARHRIAGALEHLYKISALTELLAGLVVRPRDGAACDRAMIAQLVDESRLLANLHYDFLPKINVSKGTIAGYEALARLRSLPGLNPEILFSSVMDHAIERAATMNAVCAALELWRALRIEQRAAPVAINCSQTVLADPAFQQALRDELYARDVPSGVLIIEITEDARPVPVDAMVRDMVALRALGVECSLDDFGKGATNFDRVFSLPVAEIKFDKGFFQHCADNAGERGILRMVIESCHARGVRTVVEGIETEHHLTVARDVGATLAQGFYWGQPMPAGTFAHIRGR